MKYFYFIIAFVLLQTSLSAQTESVGIQFIHDNMKEAIAKAKAENKIIFIDCFTTWCGPCKMMSKLTFTDPAVAAYYNSKFVNLKLDMEAGDGPILQKKQGITAFPTLLFLNGDGEAVHKAIGFQDAEQFLDIGNKAFNANDGLSAWTKRYENGDRGSDFLKTYALKLQEVADLRSQTVAVNYFQTQSDKAFTPENLDFIYSFAESAADTFFYTIAHNRKIFETRFTPAEIQQKVKTIADEKLYNNQNLPTLTEADTLIVLSKPENFTRTALFYRLTYYRMKGDRINYATSAVHYFKKYNDRADELSEAAFTFNEQIEDKKQLKTALKWAKRSAKLQKSVSNEMNVVHLYNKLGKNKKAGNAAKEAIEIGKKTGEDASEASEFLMKEKK